MGVPDNASAPGLSDLKVRADSDMVRIWLADRGFVAVERLLMERLKTSDGVVYHADGDYYFKRT